MNPSIQLPPMESLSISRRIAIKLLMWLANGVLLPTLQWVAHGFLTPAQKTESPAPAYTEPMGIINPLVLMAARGDMFAFLAEHPEAAQAELNACMEALRADSIRSPLLTMMGMLVGQGYPPDEAMVRMCANVLCLGLYLERRISADEYEPLTEIPGIPIDPLKGETA
jgi:hypothetical protein